MPLPSKIRGIRKRWMLNSISVVLLVVLVAVSAFSIAMSSYYYASLSTGLTNTAKTVAGFFENYTESEYRANMTRQIASFEEKDRLDLQFLSRYGRIQESTSGLTAFNFLPEEEQIAPEDGQASEVQFSISHNYDGDFRLDEQSGLYLKWQFGKPQTDAGNGDAQLAFENLLVLYGGFSNIEGTELIKVDFVSGGMGYYFSAGGYEEILWKKTDYANGFELTRANGEPLQLNAGRTYLAVVRDTNAAEMKITA